MINYANYELIIDYKGFATYKLTSKVANQLENLIGSKMKGISVNYSAISFYVTQSAFSKNELKQYIENSYSHLPRITINNVRKTV